MNPPVKRNITLFPYEAPMVLTVIGLPSGPLEKSEEIMSGRRTVTGIGMASLIHNTAMRRAVAAVIFPGSGRELGWRKNTAAEARNPSTSLSQRRRLRGSDSAGACSPGDCCFTSVLPLVSR